MTVNYQIGLYDPTGLNLLAVLDGFSVLDYALIVNGVGALTITLPADYDSFLFSSNDVIPDNRIIVSRAIGGDAFTIDGDACWFVRRGRKILSDKGQRTTIINAVHANHLLKRRIVAYAAGSAEADKTDFADDMIKAIARENLGTLATDTTRSIATYLSIAADIGAAQSISKAFARRNVLDLSREIAEASYQAGTFLAFDIVSTSPESLTLNTYIEQRGSDRRFPVGNNPLIFGTEYGNVGSAERDSDRTEEITFGYAGGLGVGSGRTIGTASDVTRIAASPFNRIEQFFDGRTSDVQATLDNDADSLVASGQPRSNFTGKITQTDGSIYGLNYNYGDYITAVFENESIDARLNRVRVQVRDGKETIDAQVVSNYG